MATFRRDDLIRTNSGAGRGITGRALLLFLFFAWGATGIANGQIIKGDRAWEGRAVPDARDVAGKVYPEPTDRSIAAYEIALAEDSASLEASWKLLRSLHYRVEFTNASDREHALSVEQAIELAERAIARADAVTGQRSGRRRAPRKECCRYAGC